uniref:Ig-like domain-containing protein n=1 Tax=Eptatretus burgeri TaxID=7764 RepID=A0A8C4WYV5_EPTBU
MWKVSLIALCISVCARVGVGTLHVKGAGAVLGGEAKLECWKDGADAQVGSLEWRDPKGNMLFFGEDKALQDPRFQMKLWDLNVSIILLKKLQHKDYGNYTCTDYGQSPPLNLSVPLVLWILPKPIELSGPHHEILENTWFNLSCTTSIGKPPADVYWRKETRRLPNQTVNVDVNGNVTCNVSILARLPDDEAPVHCVVNHTSGSSSVPWLLSIGHLPKLQISKANGSWMEGQELKVECRANGRPRPSGTRWFRGRTPVSSSLLLNFSSLTMSDAGLYECLSVNIFGQSRATFNLSVERLKSVTPTGVTTNTSAAPVPSNDWLLVAGSVCLCLFILIIIAVATARYFNNHKGSYVTHEGRVAPFDPEVETLTPNGGASHDGKEFFM